MWTDARQTLICNYYSPNADTIVITPPTILQVIFAILMISIVFSSYYSKISITATIAFATFFIVFTTSSNSIPYHTSYLHSLSSDIIQSNLIGHFLQQQNIVCPTFLIQILLSKQPSNTSYSTTNCST